MDDRLKYIVLLLPLLFLAGCTQSNTSSGSSLSNFKCTLPSRPGTIEANITGFPEQIVVSSSQDTPVTFSVMFTNTMTDAGYKTQKISVHWQYVPNVGKIDKGTVDIPLAQYYQTENKVVPMIGEDTVESEIPKEMSVIGAYTGTFSWTFNAKTLADIPICIGYDPKITGVSESELVCSPDDIPQPCYSSSPIEVKVSKVTCIGAPPKGGSKITGQCIVTLTVTDAYGGLGKCFQHRIIQEENVTLEKIGLIVDNKEFTMNDGTGVLTCTGYSKDKNGNNILYLSRSNIITCIIDLSKLEKECSSSGQCYVDSSTFLLGKSALLSVELEYDYCMAKKLGPAQLIKVD